MSWITDLYETKIKDKDLLPIGHSTANAQITVTVFENGDFAKAEVVPKEKDSSVFVTVIPVTEKSASRSNGVSAHPLHDKLEYVAGDFEKYYAPLEKEKTKKELSKKYQEYLKGICSWADSQYSCAEINAVRKYVEKGQLVKDLISENILQTQDGILTNAKISTVDQRDCFVRFDVILEDESIEEIPLYENFDIYDLYSKFYSECNSKGEKSLCYVTGENVVCAEKHSAKICHAADKSKLISANGDNFEYLGRFTDKKQAVGISAEVSEKSHNNLKFLIQKQGFKLGTLAIVAWEKRGAKIIPLMKSTADAFDDIYYEENSSLGTQFAQRLKNSASGYYGNLDTKSEIVVLALEAATTGRLSVVFYEKFSGSDFMKNILYWHKSLAWKHKYFKKNSEGKTEVKWTFSAPSPKEIAETCFGDKNEKLTQATVKRLLPCIIYKKPLPKDLMISAMKRCINPSSYKNKSDFQNQVCLTCALIKKVIYDNTKEEFSMALDENLMDRSYVFGRLLAVAQKIEEEALESDNANRVITSAERYMSQFVKTPAKTFAVIEEKLSIYKQKLKNNKKDYRVSYMEKIFDLFETEDFNNNPLNEMYLLGYNCQMNNFYVKKVNKTEEE